MRRSQEQGRSVDVPSNVRIAIELTELQTLMCASVIKHLQGVFKDRDAQILCIYLNHKEQGDQSLDNLISSLLKQIIQREGVEFRSARAKSLYQGAGNGGRPTLEEFYHALVEELDSYERTFVVVSTSPFTSYCSPHRRVPAATLHLELQHSKMFKMFTDADALGRRLGRSHPQDCTKTNPKITDAIGRRDKHFDDLTAYRK